MRILVVNVLYPPDSPGGAEKVVWDLANFLAGEGHQVTVLALALQGGVRFGHSGAVRVLRIPLVNVYCPYDGRRRHPVLRALWHLLDRCNLPMYRLLRRVFTNLKPDVVHTHNLSGLSSLAWLAAKHAGLPVLHTLHDYYQLCLKATCYRNGACHAPCLACRAGSVVPRWASRNVAAVSAVSPFVLERHLERGFFPGASWAGVVPNGCQPAREAPAPKRNPGFLTLGYLGRLETEKGILWLLRTLEDRAEVPGWRLLVGGVSRDPAFQEALKAHLPGRVEFRGQVEPQGFLRELDLLVVPSLWHEPFGLVVLEAMAQGVPVAGAARGGIRDLVAEGEDGFLFEPEAPASFLAVLDGILGGSVSLEGMAEACRAKSARYSNEAAFRRFLERYGEIRHAPGKKGS